MHVPFQLNCCGGSGPDDYINSRYDNNTISVLPQSCCLLSNRNAAIENPNDASPVDPIKCMNMSSTDFYYTTVRNYHILHSKHICSYQKPRNGFFDKK